MANQKYSNMNYEELVNSGKSNNDLSDLVTKFEEDSCCICEPEAESNETPEHTIVIVKESSISDEEARLPYQTKEQTIYAHALIHLWWNMPEKTKWSRLQVSREHTRIVAKLVSNSWGHILIDSLDESLPNSLMKDYAPSNGEESVKPTKLIIVNNSKKNKNAPMVEIDYEEIGAIKVILNQAVFESSVNSMEDNDQEYKRYLDEITEVTEKEDALYLRINAMHEGTWNFTEISREELEKAASTYTGRLVIEAHKWDDPERAIGEVLKASVKFDGELQKYYLEVIAKITKDRAIKEVKARRYKFVSIGASMQARCNICGMTVSEGCNHIRGVEYDTNHGRLLCVKIASEIIFEELSFINVPAARWARILEELDPTQARELLAASKSRSTFSIEVESEDTRILPTLDEFLTLQENSIIKLYNRKEEVSNMAQEKNEEITKTEETFVAPGSAAPSSAPDAATPQNAINKPDEITPTPSTEKTIGNVSDVEAPSNPTDGGTVDTGSNEASKEEVPMPTNSESDPMANTSDVPATQHPLDGGTVDTGAGVNTTGEAEDMNPIVRSDEVTEEGSVQNDTLSLTNEQIDSMDISAVYEYAKTNSMNSLVDTLIFANEEECKNTTIEIKHEGEAILAHAILHMWLDDLTLTNWTEEAIKAEHDRIVQVLDTFGIGHFDESEGSTETIDDNVQSNEVTTNETVEQTAEVITTEEVDSTEVIDENLKTIELLNGQIEGLKKDLEDTKNSYEVTISNLKLENEKVSNEIYTLKLNLAKSCRLNKKLESDLVLINSLVSGKTSEIEILNSKLDSYSKKEFNEVVEQLISVKTDINKYSDEDAVDKDRKKFSSMTIESLKAVLDELLVSKEDLLKNTVAEEFGLGEVSNVEKIENTVDANSEMQNYQKQEGEDKKDVTNNESTTQKEVVEDSSKFTVRDGSILSLVKKSLDLK